MSGMHLSKEFFELIKAIGESKSKQEEDRIIATEILALKKKLDGSSSSSGSGNNNGVMMSPGSPIPTMGTPGGKGGALGSKKKAREFLVRLLYVEMLGHDGSFGFIKAVELAAAQSIMHKKTGYLICSCCLSPDHEFRFMLVNQMQRDLISSNLLECQGALVAVTNLITPDLVTTVSTQVIGLLDHNSEPVRKKAIIALHRLHQLSPDAVTKEELVDKLRKMLCDRDPSVMGSTLNAIEAMARVDVRPFKDLIPSLVSVLKQICERRLPSDFDYHRIPAPWIQMKLVRILSVIGKNDSQASEGMYEVVADCLRKADEAGINASNAIVYECIRCITTIYPNPVLLDAAGASISRFLSSRNQNLKYLGVTGLASIVERHPKYAADHQLAVIECLEDKDETLLRKTLDLLYRMTNPVNVEFITERLLHFLRGSTDPYMKKDLTGKICTIAERYAPNNAWYVRTITELFKIGGDMVDPAVATNLMSLIAEGTGNEDDDEEADMVLRKQAVELYVSILGNPPNRMPRVLVETLAWVLGEYGYLSSAMSLDAIIDSMCTLLQSGNTAKLGGGAATTRRLVLSAIMKMVAQFGSCPAAAAKCIDDYTKSQDPDTQRRCLEFMAMLSTAPYLLGEVFPVDASLEDVEVDVSLSFMNGLVAEAVSNGARPYQKPEDDDDDDIYGGGAGSSGASAFKMTPYEKPTEKTYGQGQMHGLGSTSMGPSGAANVALPPGGAMNAHGGGGVTPVPAVQPASDGLTLRSTANVWGKKSAAVPAQTAPATNSFATSTNSFANTNTMNSSTSSGGYGASNSGYGGSSTYGGSSNYGAYGASQPAPTPAAPQKTAEQIQKEKMAAALFGGISATQPPAPTQSSAPPPPPSAAPVAATPQGQWGAKPASQAPPPTPITPAQPAPAPVVAPAPAPEIDLLGFDAPATASTTSSVDMLAPTLMMDEPAAPPEPSLAPEPAAPAPPAAPVDPFADAGLLDGVTQTSLPSFSAPNAFDSAKYEYGGSPVAPLTINTPQFGEHWGSCHSTHPISIPSSSSVNTLSKFMALCEKAGLHKVEEIMATNEGIAACMAGGGSAVALVHGKITPLPTGTSRVDVMVKSTDPGLSQGLSLHLQNMIR